MMDQKAGPEERPIPFHQNPDAHVYGGPGDPPEEEIDYGIDWDLTIPEENRRKPTSEEIITMLNEVRKQAADAGPGGYVELRGRNEVVVHVAAEIEERNQGKCIIDLCEDGPRWLAEKGYWESSLNVFANQSEMSAFLADI